MRSDYPICPTCKAGRLVPLMFGPGKCDLACETAPVAQDYSFANLVKHEITYEPGRVTQPARDGFLRIEQHPFKQVQRYTLHYSAPGFLDKLAGCRVLVSVGLTTCAAMQVISSGKVVVVLDPSDDAKKMWRPGGAVPAVLVIL